MNLRGDVIEESLNDKSILKSLNIISTRVEKVTKSHKTPWLKQWTLHTVDINEDEAPQLAEKLSKKLEPNYWYIDFKNTDTHYIIFPYKTFKVNRKKPEQYKPVVKYGLELGIPDYQLDFSPYIKYWDRPEK